MEAIMAIMVISASASLVVMVLPRMASIEVEAGDLQKDAERCRHQIMELISDDGITIHASSLYRLHELDLFMEVARGIRVELKVQGDAPSDILLMSRGELPDSLSEYYALSGPVVYEEGGMRVSPAHLVIGLW